MVSEYKNYKRFYNDSAAFVVDYCREHNIECYIKEKTITNTESL